MGTTNILPGTTNVKSYYKKSQSHTVTFVMYKNIPPPKKINQNNLFEYCLSVTWFRIAGP